MDDVDYLVEDNARDDFFLSSEMDVTHGRTTFEDDPEQQLLGCKLGTECKCWEYFNHHICLRFRSGW